MAEVGKSALALALITLAGCSGTTQLVPNRSSSSTTAASASSTTHATSASRRSTAPARSTTIARPPSAESVYLARLGAEQAELAAAERGIPTSPRTPAGLARSIDLLGGAVSRLADGLHGITAPPAVASDHARLVAIMRTYAAQLARAARLARSRAGEGPAGRLLLSATSTASQGFTATIATIEATLGREGR